MIHRGDIVRVKFYRDRQSKREFIVSRIGKVELTHRDRVWVRFEDGRKPEPYPAHDVEKICG